MKKFASREKLLKSIRNAQFKAGKNEVEVVETHESIFPPEKSSLAEKFAYEFNNVSGKFIYCNNTGDFLSQLNLLAKVRKWSNIFTTESHFQNLGETINTPIINNLDEYSIADAGLTTCEGLIARTGSIIVSSGVEKSRTLSVYPPAHIVVAYRNQIYFDLKEAISDFKQRYGQKYPSMLSIITGPSRTADIEKTLVLGAHGPKDLFCFYINEYLSN